MLDFLAAITRIHHKKLQMGQKDVDICDIWIWAMRILKMSLQQDDYDQTEKEIIKFIKLMILVIVGEREDIEERITS